MSKDSKRLHVYRVVDKGRNEPGFWVRIGTAFENKDGSLSVVLDALPVDGRLQIREPKEREEERDNGRGRDDGRRDDRSYGDRR